MNDNGDVDYDKINSLGFTVFDRVRDFADLLEEGNISSPEVYLTYEEENGDYHLDMLAIDGYQQFSYAIDSQTHPDLNEAEFGILYDLWEMTIEEEITDDIVLTPKPVPEYGI